MTAPVRDAGVINAAGGYDLLVWLLMRGRERQFRELLLSFAKLRTGERVVDAGCGTGSTAIIAARMVGVTGSVTGIDPSPNMIARATRKARGAGVAADFRIGRAESLPLEDASCDVVISTMMMHHLRAQTRRDFAAECRRVLKPGGRVFVTDFGPPLPGQTGLVQWLHRKHFLDLPRIIAPFGDADFAVTQSGDVGVKSLVYAVAVRS
jgi:ubiquinone/menaquinone biosynthesis C-methylase UbiE